MLESTAYERGSSWTVEVRGNMKVCSIVVENLNKNGQMVVEVLVLVLIVSLVYNIISVFFCFDPKDNYSLFS